MFGGGFRAHQADKPHDLRALRVILGCVTNALAPPDLGRIPKFPRGVATINLQAGNPTAMPLSAESSRSIEMKGLLLAGATVALLTAVNFAPAMAQGPKLSSGNTWAGIFQPIDNAQPLHPIPQTMYEEVIVEYRIGSGHKAIYANITDNQMWSLVQSKFGQLSQQSAIAEARRACEDYATQSNLDPSKCVPVEVDDRQVFDPGPLFRPYKPRRANKQTWLHY